MSAIAAPVSVRNPVLRLVLRVPLFWKLVGANAIILVLSVFLLSSFGAAVAPIALPYEYFVLLGLTLGGIVNVWLVRIALEPVLELQHVAEMVANGVVTARGKNFPQADERIKRLVDTTNLMLDRIADDRARLKQLAAAVVEAQQTERSDVARDLHDSVAQTLTAATFILTGALSNKMDDALGESIREAQELIRTACEELRSVSQALHPRVASDLGLPAALESLANVVRQRSLIDVFIVTDIDDAGIPGSLTPTLYWVASEALHEVELRGTANCATIALTAKGGQINLTVIDDGTADALGETTPVDSAFQAARDRFSLAGGDVHIEPMLDGGIRVTARITTERKAA
jgi:two-component system, NarL family, sensor histidine kinase UhpB